VNEVKRGEKSRAWHRSCWGGEIEKGVEGEIRGDGGERKNLSSIGPKGGGRQRLTSGNGGGRSNASATVSSRGHRAPGVLKRTALKGGGETYEGAGSGFMEAKKKDNVHKTGTKKWDSITRGYYKKKKRPGGSIKQQGENWFPLRFNDARDPRCCFSKSGRKGRIPAKLTRKKRESLNGQVCKMGGSRI